MELPYPQIRDLSSAQPGEAAPATDIRGFFRSFALRTVSQASRQKVVDLAKWSAGPIRILCDKTLMVDAPGIRHLRDVALPRRNRTKKWFVRTLLGREKPIVASPDRIVNILFPLPELAANHLDIRALKPVESARTYPDFYRLPSHPRTILLRRAKRVAKNAIRTVGWSLAIAASIGFVATAGAMLVRSDVEYAYRSLTTMGGVENLAEAESLVADAHSRLFRARLVTAPLVLVDAAIGGSIPSLRAGLAAIDGGSALTSALSQLLALAGDAVRQGALPPDLVPKGLVTLDLATGSGASQIPLTSYLALIKPRLQAIDDDLAVTLASYRELPPDLLPDPELARKFEAGIARLDILHRMLSGVLAHSDEILYALGNSRPMRYLVLNQNRDELRAGGGFPGTLFFVELYQGNIRRFDRLDVYDVDWKIAPYHEDPPVPLRELSSNFGLRDANYFMDFAESAKKIDFFFQKAGNPSLDGVLAINQGLVTDLLERYGGVYVPSLGREVTKKNFSLLLSTIVEAKIQPYQKVGQDRFISPKSFLFDFSSELVRKLVAKKDAPGYLMVLEDAVARGEVLFSGVRDSTIDSLASAAGMTQGWKTATGEWIYPVFTSLSGNKSDRSMRRSIALAATTRVGACRYDVTLTDEHSFGPEREAEVKTILGDYAVPQADWADLIRIQGKGKNHTYVRFMVPWRATLEGAGGFTTEYHGNKTVFATTIDTMPLATTVTKFSYTKPRAVGESCSTPKFYKQPGLSIEIR